MSGQKSSNKRAERKRRGAAVYEKELAKHLKPETAEEKALKRAQRAREEGRVITFEQPQTPSRRER